ncbi:unnamed protein product [Merluccius merluccius]
MGAEEWLCRLKASSGTWPSGAGNRPSPRQAKWFHLYQKSCSIHFSCLSLHFSCLSLHLSCLSLHLSCLSLHLSGPCTEPWEACIDAVNASLQPCHYPSWEKHSLRYPTSSDASFQSEIHQAPFSLPPSSPVMSSVRTGSSPLTPDQFWLPAEMKKTIPQQDQRWIASTLWSNQRLRPDVKLWYEPPAPALIYNQAPTPERFIAHRLLPVESEAVLPKV